MSRKIDKLVAEKIMGWNRMPLGSWSHQANRIWSVNENQIPHYSTDIRQAWNVVNALTSTTKQWAELRQYSTGCTVTFSIEGDGENDRESIADEIEAPLAICIAALKSVGVTDEQITRATDPSGSKTPATSPAQPRPAPSPPAP